MPELTWAELAGQAGEALNPIPQGEYNAVITKAEVKFAKSGKKMFAISAKVVDGPHANRMFWNNFTLSPENPNAMVIFFRQMQALGLPMTFFQANPTDAEVSAALTGAQFRARLGIGTYMGTDSNNLEAVFPPATGVVSPPNGVGPQPASASVQGVLPAQPQAGVPVPSVPVDQPPAVQQPAPQPAPPAAEAPVAQPGPSVEELQAQLAALQAQTAQPAAEAQPAATTDWAAEARQVVEQAAPPQPAPASQDLGQAETGPKPPF